VDSVENSSADGGDQLLGVSRASCLLQGDQRYGRRWRGRRRHEPDEARYKQRATRSNEPAASVHETGSGA
jgi:hypothetical protein